MTLENIFLRRTHPGTGNDLVAQAGGTEIIDLVADNDPSDSFLLRRGCCRIPMRGRHVLDPAHVDNIIHMVKLVDVMRQIQRDEMAPEAEDRG